MNLAYMMLRIIVAALIRNFNVAAPPETNESSMEIKDAFVSLPACPVDLLKKLFTQVIFPAAMECKLFFHPRN